jgi:xanthosine phosphorylase
MSTMYQQLLKITNDIQKKVPNLTPKIGMILGSGLGSITTDFTEQTEIPYHEIPGFPRSTVPGHKGSLTLCKLNDVPIVCLNGRIHTYEGTSSDQMKTFIRLLKCLGCQILLTTNAVGSLKEQIGIGELAVITDHINLFMMNPLIGPNEEEFGPRFFSMENAYDKNLRILLLETAKELNIPLHEGIYTATLGPSFETPSEIRASRTLGIDLVGMSTIPEVLIARHCGLKVVAIASVTNLAAGLSDEPISHEITLKGAKQCSENLSRLIKAFVIKLTT